MSVYRFAVQYRWWLIAALATLFVLMAGFELSILPDEVANKCSQPNSTNKNYCSGYIVAGALLDIVARFLKPYSDVLTALSGIAVAAFTLTLWLTTRQMWRASIDQISLARQEFIASHRPRVIVRSINYPTVSYKEEPPRESVLICIVNNGVTDAILVGFEGHIYRHFPGDSYWPNTARIKTVSPVRLISGERHYRTVSGRQPYDEAENADEVNGKCVLWVWGRLVYEDDNGARRETGFWRRLDRKRETYVASDDPSQENQD